MTFRIIEMAVTQCLLYRGQFYLTTSGFSLIMYNFLYFRLTIVALKLAIVNGQV